MKKILLTCVFSFVFLLCLTKYSNAGVWSTLGTGMDASVRAVTSFNNELYAGGDFTTADGNSVNYIAKWDGSSWSALGTGMNNNIQALGVFNNELYAGGNFTTAGGNVANYIAKWNGLTWNAVGTGMNGPVVYVLGVFGDNLYVGGFFTTAGGSPANNIAKWNGSAWSSVDSGTNSDVNAIAVYNNELVIGGLFSTAGGSPASRIAKWTGLAWGTLGSGMNSPVYSLNVFNSELYAGGLFTTAGGNSANYIAKWNGSSWSAVSSGMDFSVQALTNYNNSLYAGGGFNTAGGNPANYIAKWDGSNWTSVDSGTDDFVNALTVLGNSLYVGGDFSSVSGGTIPANFIAEWTEDVTAPTTIASPTGGTYSNSQSITLTPDETATTYYTTDGTTPTTSSSVYNSPILINSNTTLNFFSVDSFGNTESVKTEIYIIDTIAPTTTILIAKNDCKFLQTVTLTATDDNTGVQAIYYTIDDSTPNSNSTIYTEPFTASYNDTIKYFSVDNAYNQEAIKTEPVFTSFDEKIKLESVTLNQYYINTKKDLDVCFYKLPKKRSIKKLYLKLISKNDRFFDGFTNKVSYKRYTRLLSNIGTVKKARFEKVNKHIKFKINIHYPEDSLKIDESNLRLFKKNRTDVWKGPYRIYQNVDKNLVKFKIRNYLLKSEKADASLENRTFAPGYYFRTLEKITFVIAEKQSLRSDALEDNEANFILE